MTNPDLCAKCGGKCCLHSPGIFDPSDFSEDLNEFDFNTMVVDMDTNGFYTNVFFIRPRIQGERKDIMVECWGGPCIFLGETGCSLSDTKRPLECRALVPASDDADCLPDSYHNTKHSIIERWINREPEVLKLIERFK